MYVGGADSPTTEKSYRELSKLGAGASFGENALINDDVRGASVKVTSDDAELFYLNRSRFNELLGEFIFGYFWLFLVILCYSWLFLVILGNLRMGNRADGVFSLQARTAKSGVGCNFAAFPCCPRFPTRRSTSSCRTSNRWRYARASACTTSGIPATACTLWRGAR